MNRFSVELNTALRRSPNSSAFFSTTTFNLNRASANRQSKILSKLVGNRVSGSKRKWFENPMNTTGQPTLDSPLNLNNPKKSDHGSQRRVKVLNKLFMTHITDLLATGQASEKILGKGLQVTRVKVTPNFQFCNVYWMAKSELHDIELEEELQKCGGLLRHELSQLRLMGEVPRIHFVKDKTFTNLAIVETILKTADFGDCPTQRDASFEVKNDLYRFPSAKVTFENKADGEDNEEPLPEMRHDVFGVDRRGIMLKILAKLKKSEQTLGQCNRKIEKETVAAAPESISKEIDKMKEKLQESENDEAFVKFLQTKKAETRKKNKRYYRSANEKYYRRVGDDDYDELEDGDFVEEDLDGQKK